MIQRGKPNPTHLQRANAYANRFTQQQNALSSRCRCCLGLSLSSGQRHQLRRILNSTTARATSCRSRRLLKIHSRARPCCRCDRWYEASSNAIVPIPGVARRNASSHAFEGVRPPHGMVTYCGGAATPDACRRPRAEDAATTGYSLAFGRSGLCGPLLDPGVTPAMGTWFKASRSPAGI